MRIFTKFLCLALALLACLTAFCGCHGARERSAFEVPEEFDTEKQHEISFWAKNDTNLTQVAIYEKAVADFEALYPNIKVNLKLYTDYGRIYNDIITNISTGTTPNVCITYPDHIATYMTGDNVVIPLDELIDDRRYGLGGKKLLFDSPKANEVVDKFLDEGVIDGKQYALPFMRSTEACYINKTLVEKLGYELPEKLTWDFIWEVSDAATKKSVDGTYEINGQKVMIPFIYKSTDNMMIQMLAQKGAGYSTDSGEVLLFNDTTEEILLEVASHVEKGAFSTFKISSYPGNYLNAGQCIFAIDSTAGATWMGADAPMMDIHSTKVSEFDIAVKEIPQFDTENPKMISQGPSMCLFNKEDPQEVLASWLFMQFLLTNDVQIAYSQTEGYVPVTEKAQKSEEYKDYLSRKGEDNELYYDVKLEATELLIRNTENTFVTPVFNGSASLRNAAGDLIEETTKAVRRKKTVNREFLDTTYDKMRSLYHLDEIVTKESSGRQRLGDLPTESVILLSSLASVWMILGVCAIVRTVKKRKNQNNIDF